MTSGARPDLEAHEHSARSAFRALVEELSQLLDPKLVA